MILDKKYRFKNLEFRWVESNYHPPYPEIICWQKSSDEKEFCHTLARWIENPEGWDLKFIGDRPFDRNSVDRKLFWELAQFGNTIVNAEWRIQRFMKER